MASILERKGKDGKVHYRVQVRIKGAPTQVATFERKTDAKNWAQATEAAIKEGRHFKTTQAKKHTLAQLIDRYKRDVLPTKKKCEKRQGAQLDWWKSQIGHRLLSDVTPSVIAEQRDILLKGITRRKTDRSPATVRRYLSALSHAFTIAIKEWGWIEDSPTQKITKPKEPRGRVRFLSEDEMKRLLPKCKESSNHYLYPVVVLALATGMRHGEIMNLKWSDIDLKNRFIILQETKNGERRRVPLVNHALQVLIEFEKVRHLHTPLLFPAKNYRKPIDLRFPWEKAIKLAEITNFRFHDLRHTAASYLVMNGASIVEVAEILGHKTLQMVKRYSHLSETHTTSVVSRMNERMFG